MTTIPPVYVGRFKPVKAGDIIDRYIDIAADLVDGEAISSVAFTVADSAGTAVSGAVTAHTETDTRTNFRLAVPSTAGGYTITAVFTIDDGQKITKIAQITAV